jgi:hypothetical protein
MMCSMRARRAAPRARVRVTLPRPPRAEAREDYLRSADGFQAAAGFRGRRGSTTARLDGGPHPYPYPISNPTLTWA